MINNYIKIDEDGNIVLSIVSNDPTLLTNGYIKINNNDIDKINPDNYKYNLKTKKLIKKNNNI